MPKIKQEQIVTIINPDATRGEQAVKKLNEKLIFIDKEIESRKQLRREFLESQAQEQLDIVRNAITKIPDTRH